MARRKTRRSPGEGTPWYDKKTGQYRWRIRWHGENHTVSDKDPERAKAKFRELKQKLEDGVKVSDGKQTFAVFMQRYLHTVIASEVGESTAHDYGKRAGYYILPTLGEYPLDQLTTELGQAWLNAMVRRGWAITSIRQALRIAKKALDRAAGEHLIPYNPFAILKPPRAPQKDADEDEEGSHALAPEQLDRLLAEVKRTDKHQTPTRGGAGRSEGLYVLYVLAVLLGLRRGELLGLRRKDIDFDQMVIRVRQQVVRRPDNSFFISKTLKTKASRRELPMLAEVAALLRPHLLRLGGGPDALLFPGKDGEARQPNGISQHFRRTCDRLGLDGFHFHDLRHTAVTNWRLAGVDLEVAAAMAGHEHTNITADVYSDATLDRKRSALEAIARLHQTKAAQG